MTAYKIRPELQKAFEKMIKGINVELSEKGKMEYKDIFKGRWLFLMEIRQDESITLMDNTHTILEGASITDIIL